MMTITVDIMIDSFPNSRIEKSDEEPNHSLTKEVEKLLITNVTSARSELGGGQNDIAIESLAIMGSLLIYLLNLSMTHQKIFFFSFHHAPLF